MALRTVPGSTQSTHPGPPIATAATGQFTDAAYDVYYTIDIHTDYIIC